MKILMNFKKQILKISAIVITLLTFFACEKVETGCVGEDCEQEQITTLKVIMTDSAGNVKSFQFKDTDGDGGIAPSVDTIILKNNEEYSVVLLLLDESNTASIDTISNEVEMESSDHLFVYKSTPEDLLNITITDKDANNLPFGLTSKWVANKIGIGSARISLKHQPNGIKDGSETPGETDADITFPMVIN